MTATGRLSAITLEAAVLTIDIEVRVRTRGFLSFAVLIFLAASTAFGQKPTPPAPPDSAPVPIVIMTHEAREGSIQKALSEIDQLDIICEKTSFIRIEDNLE